MTQTARLYGGSMYELAAEEQKTDVILEQMQVIRKLFYEQPEYLRLLCEPSVAKGERTDLIEAAFGGQAERYLVNFLKLLCERGILNEYAGCCDEFKKRYNADQGITEAVVTAAVPLSETQLEALKEKLETVSGKRVSLVQKLDASVMAGLRVELEGKQMDGTVKGRLSGISRTLNELIV